MESWLGSLEREEIGGKRKGKRRNEEKRKGKERGSCCQKCPVRQRRRMECEVASVELPLRSKFGGGSTEVVSSTEGPPGVRRPKFISLLFQS
ncbi:Uncharacterized protein TCM_020878 [Theobroma cacao]|uniref:Uncharacterized protein n=1 Tax=Theobroma cacao TaxID=3641 RepID=A0A061ELV0_THECC|nr:Uncharacterized protein TCM_020878 [Theobroma cacao]